jgi:hypothetical protein
MKFYTPGARIAGRYEVASRPMMGGMGVVYVCLDHREGRPVALKTFKPEYLPDQEARGRFLREGTAWVELGRHPHVVRCYQVERIGDGREVYLVLELVAKEQGRDDASLRSWLTPSTGSGQGPGAPLDVETAPLFAVQIVRGMAHAADVAHLPVSVRVRRAGQTLVIALEPIAVLPQQAPHGVTSHWIALDGQHLTQLAQAVPHPFLIAHRIPCHFIVYQCQQRRFYLGLFFSTRFRPPPGRRTRFSGRSANS